MTASLAFFQLDDTIAAISSPAMASKIGIVRVSGPAAMVIACRLAGWDEKETARRCIAYARIPIALTTAIGDMGCRCPVRLLMMPAPCSYTREHVAEFHVPGAPAIVQAVYNAVLDAGARPAEAGEFTFRAFARGRLDLGQAEAVERLISATSAAERQQALRRLSMPLAKRIADWREEMMSCAALLEVVLDLEPQECDGALSSEIESRLADLATACQGLAGQAAQSDRRSEIARVALLGLANAGKSSLANALLGCPAALVAEEAGTTRDLLAWQMPMPGLPLLLLDTVGYLPHGTGWEADAFRHACERALAADVLCLVIDGSQPPTADLRLMLRHLRGRRAVVIRSKADLPQRWEMAEALALCAQEGIDVAAHLSVSAVSGQSVEDLRQTIASLIDVGQASCLSAREAGELSAANRACAAALGAWREGSMELAAEELRTAHDALSRLAGEGYAEDVLARIFSRFCVGK